MKPLYRRPENDPAHKENSVIQDNDQVPFDVDTPEDWGFTVTPEVVKQLAADPDRLPAAGRYRFQCGKARKFSFAKDDKPGFLGVEIPLTVVVPPDGVLEPDTGFPKPRIRFRFKHTRPSEQERQTLQIDRRSFAQFVQAIQGGGYIELDGEAGPQEILEACENAEVWITVIHSQDVNKKGEKVVYQNFRNFEPAPAGP